MVKMNGKRNTKYIVIIVLSTFLIIIQIQSLFFSSSGDGGITAGKSNMLKPIDPVELWGKQCKSFYLMKDNKPSMAIPTSKNVLILGINDRTDYYGREYNRVFSGIDSPNRLEWFLCVSSEVDKKIVQNNRYLYQYDEKYFKELLHINASSNFTLLLDSLGCVRLFKDYLVDGHELGTLIKKYK